MRRPPRLVVFAAAGLGVALAFLILQPRLGITPDSAGYLGSARNLARGEGLTLPFASSASPPGAPMTYFPPLYPALLAAGDLLSLDIVEWARVLNAVLLGLIGVLAALMIVRSSGSWGFGILGFILVVGAPSILRVHSELMAEPLYIAVTLCGAFALVAYLKSGRTAHLLLAGSVAALGPLSRWVGVANVGAGLLALLALDSRRVRHRVNAAAVFGTIGLGPVVVCVARNAVVASDATARTLGFHPPDRRHWNRALHTAQSWFIEGPVPVSLRRPLFVLVSLAVLVLALFSLAKSGKSSPIARAWARGEPLTNVLALFAGAYVVVVTVSITFIGLDILPDTRILSPLYVVAIVLSVSVLAHMTAVARPLGRVWRTVGIVFAVLVGGLWFVRGANWAAGDLDRERHLARRAWRESPLMAEVASLEAGDVLYSNAPDAVWFYTGRPSWSVPEQYDQQSEEPNPAYSEQVAAMIDHIRSAHGAVAYFDLVDWRWYLPTADEVAEEGKLVTKLRLRDGVVLVPAARP